MNNLDKRIMTAARDLDCLAHSGFTPAWAELLQTPADRMHALLVERADALMGCTEGSLRPGPPRGSRTRDAYRPMRSRLMRPSDERTARSREARAADHV